MPPAMSTRTPLAAYSFAPTTQSETTRGQTARFTLVGRGYGPASDVTELNVEGMTRRLRPTQRRDYDLGTNPAVPHAELLCWHGDQRLASSALSGRSLPTAWPGA